MLRQHVHFSREIEFYEFAQQRFYKQAQFLTLGVEQSCMEKNWINLMCLCQQQHRQYI